MADPALSPRGALELALSLQKQGRLEDAAALYLGVLAMAPRDFNARHMLGMVRHRQRRHDEAEALIREALALEPASVAAHANLGNVLRAQGREADSLALYDRALALMGRSGAPPAEVGAVLGLRGVSNVLLERHAQAEADLAAAHSLRPEDGETRLALGILRLALGDYARGWPLYEARLPAAGARLRFPLDPARRWDGHAPLRGRRLLVAAEQGIGDTVMALRCVPMAQAAGARVRLRLQPALAVLAGASFPSVEVESTEAEVGPHDLHVPALSLPAAFGATSPDRVPAPIPYLRVPPASASAWAMRLPPTGRPKVGLCWRGNPTYDDDRRRSFALARLAPLLRRTDCEFHSLQLEVRDDERALHARLAPTGTGFGGVEDNAAAIARMDLVVTVDTASAHLAGALGVPAWVLLSTAPYWPWGVRGEAGPWYPRVRIFRQERAGDWDGVVARVARALDAFLSR